LFDRLRGRWNARQEKVLVRMAREGPNGFQGGLSAENYLRITGTSRATATRDLQDLVEMGALMRSGVLKGTRYWLPFQVAENFFEVVEEEKTTSDGSVIPKGSL
jgi:Fic family protein